MTTADDLLRGILAEPEADAPRLILADWLEDRAGPGDAERAEFIRLQVELARRATDGPHQTHRGEACPCQECQGLRRRERELLEHADDSWWGGGGNIQWDFLSPVLCRGFVARVTCRGIDWWGEPGHPGHGPAIVRASPLEAVEVSDRAPTRLSRLGAFTWFVMTGESSTTEDHWVPSALAPVWPKTGSAGGPDHRHYPTPEAARLALSTAALQWSWQPPCRECGGDGIHQVDTGGNAWQSPCRLCHGLGRDLSAPSERPQRVGK